jgi:hypothetical protein
MSLRRHISCCRPTAAFVESVSGVSANPLVNVLVCRLVAICYPRDALPTAQCNQNTHTHAVCQAYPVHKKCAERAQGILCLAASSGVGGSTSGSLSASMAGSSSLAVSTSSDHCSSSVGASPARSSGLANASSAVQAVLYVLLTHEVSLCERVYNRPVLIELRLVGWLVLVVEQASIRIFCYKPKSCSCRSIKKQSWSSS